MNAPIFRHGLPGDAARLSRVPRLRTASMLHSCLFVILLALLPGLSQANDMHSSCGKLPVATSAQAMCLARHYLEASSELCFGAVRYDYAAETNGDSWVVRVTPRGAPAACTGDVLEIDRATGSLMRWDRVRLDSPLIHYAQ
ncbi:MAG TPA: hypothetical protein VIU46_03435 [Gallionellaceae bacterium]